MKMEDLILPGALLIGGYLLYSKILQPIIKPITDVGGSLIDSISPTPLPGTLMLEDTPGTKKTLNAVEQTLEKLGIPNINFTKEINKLLNPDNIKVETAQAIKQMDASYKKYYTIPKVNKLASTKSAAVLTNFNKLQTPQVQIQAFNTAPKVVKVGNSFKKVM